MRARVAIIALVAITGPRHVRPSATSAGGRRATRTARHAAVSMGDDGHGRAESRGPYPAHTGRRDRSTAHADSRLRAAGMEGARPVESVHPSPAPRRSAESGR